VEPEPEHPAPDVVLGQIHQLAAGVDPSQQEVTVGRPLLRAEVALRVLEVELDLEPRRLGEGQRQRTASEREAEQQPATVAVELDTVVQRNACDRPAEGLLQGRQVAPVDVPCWLAPPQVGASRKRSLIVVPCSGWKSAGTVPPLASTMRRTIASPSPVPMIVRVPEPRKNGSNAWRASSADIPSPLSDTRSS
jgi:hypothetical protein